MIFSKSRVILWLPAIIVVIGVIALGGIYRTQNATDIVDPVPVSAQQRFQLIAIEQEAQEDGPILRWTNSEKCKENLVYFSDQQDRFGTLGAECVGSGNAWVCETRLRERLEAGQRYWIQPVGRLCDDGATDTIGADVVIVQL